MKLVNTSRNFPDKTVTYKRDDYFVHIIQFRRKSSLLIIILYKFNQKAKTKTPCRADNNLKRYTIKTYKKLTSEEVYVLSFS